MANMITVKIPCIHCQGFTRYESNRQCPCKASQYASRQKVYNAAYYEENKSELKRKAVNKTADMRAANIRRAIEDRQDQKRIDEGRSHFYWLDEVGTISKEAFDNLPAPSLQVQTGKHRLGPMMDAF